MRFDVNHHHHYPSDPEFQRAILNHLRYLEEQGKRIMATLQDLQAAVAANTSAVNSSIVFINGLAAKIAELKNDPVAIQALADELTTDAANLSAAITANTDAPPA